MIRNNAIMMNNILTIVIPTYNMEKYLDRCLSSLIVKDEQLDNLEVLVINDGSKDRSSEIAHAYEARYPQTFRVIDKENGNYGSCVNRGVSEATGKYIKILDADDWFSSAFPSYLSFLEEHDTDLVLSDFDFINISGKVLRTVHYDLPAGENLPLQLLLPSASNIWMHAVTYRTQIVRDSGYKQTEGISYTDQEWVFYPMSRVKHFCYYGNALYEYLVGRAGQTIDPAVWIKSSSQEMHSAGVMLGQYFEEKEQISESVRSYWEARILYRSKIIYDHILIGAPVNQNSDWYGLRGYDACLSEKCPSVYKQLDDEIVSKKIPYHYIRDWRLNTGIGTLRLRLVHFAKNMRNLILRVTGK